MATLCRKSDEPSAVFWKMPEMQEIVGGLQDVKVDKDKNGVSKSPNLPKSATRNIKTTKEIRTKQNKIKIH